MRQAYRTIQDVLASPWAASGVPAESTPTTDRILRSTKDLQKNNICGYRFDE